VSVCVCVFICDDCDVCACVIVCCVWKIRILLHVCVCVYEIYVEFIHVYTQVMKASLLMAKTSFATEWNCLCEWISIAVKCCPAIAVN